MRSKRFSFAALILAALLVLSFGLIAFAGCGGDDGENEGGGGGGGGESTSAAKFVTDTSLQNKLLAMYPFEEGDASGGDTLYEYNPFNGSAITSANGVYDSTITGQATTGTNGLTQDQYQLTSPSTKALDSKYSVFLSGTMNELYERDSNGEIAWDNGVSISFWAYNHEKDKTISDGDVGSLAIDYANLVTNGQSLSITWGNLNPTNGDVMYPDRNTTVGRAAYTDEFTTGEASVGSYYDAIAEGYTTEQLRHFDSFYADAPYDYTGWNVISGNVQDANPGSTVDVISEYCHHTWRYITVSIQEDGIYFYMNGRLAYYYSESGYLVALPNSWTEFAANQPMIASDYYRFIAGLVGGKGLNMLEEEFDYNTYYFFNLFGYDAKAYVDDVIIGYALNADEACALYENLSGVTYEAEDLTISSGMSAEEEAKQDAKVEAVEDRVTEYETAVSESEAANGYTATQRDALRNDGLDDYERAALETIGTRTTNGEGTVGGKNYYVPAVNDDGTFELSVTLLQLSSMSGTAYYQAFYPMVYALGGDSSWDKVVGFQSGGAGSSYGSGSSETWMSGIAIDEKTSVGNVEGLDNAQASNGLVWTGESDTGVDFTEVSHYCWIVVTLEWDGTNLTLSWTYYYYFADETLEWTYEYNGTQSASEKIGFMAASSFGTIGYTIEAESGDLSDLFDTSDLAIRLGSENTAYVVVTGVEGGEVYGQS